MSSNQQVLALARYRIQQANESLNEAEILQREQAWRGAINRAYYAMYYAVTALTVVQGYSTSKHAGVIAFFEAICKNWHIFQGSFQKATFSLRTMSGARLWVVYRCR